MKTTVVEVFHFTDPVKMRKAITNSNAGVKGVIDVRQIKRCQSKLRYPDKKAAVSQLNRLVRRRRGPKPVRAYYCGRCGGWHLTKQEEMENGN